MKKTITTAAIAAILLSAGVALAAAPVCGDVNNSSSINTTDALLVLKKSVNQSTALSCSAYDNQFSACQSDLSACQDAPACGDSILEGTEDCEAGNLNSETCVTQGFAGGTLACATGCAFDTSACYEARFDASGDTIIDHVTGLEWERKDAAGGGANLADPHDVDNLYQWTSTGVAPDGGAFTDFLVRLNDCTSTNGVSMTGGYAGHCDWRMPTSVELYSIGIAGPAFQPDAASQYWSASTTAGTATYAWFANTSEGSVSATDKTMTKFVRAVRSGS